MVYNNCVFISDHDLFESEHMAFSCFELLYGQSSHTVHYVPEVYKLIMIDSSEDEKAVWLLSTSPECNFTFNKADSKVLIKVIINVFVMNVQ